MVNLVRVFASKIGDHRKRSTLLLRSVWSHSIPTDGQMRAFWHSYEDLQWKLIWKRDASCGRYKATSWIAWSLRPGHDLRSRWFRETEAAMRVSVIALSSQRLWWRHLKRTNEARNESITTIFCQCAHSDFKDKLFKLHLILIYRPHNSGPYSSNKTLSYPSRAWTSIECYAYCAHGPNAVCPLISDTVHNRLATLWYHA